MSRLLIVTTIAMFLTGSVAAIPSQVQASPEQIALFGIGEKKKKGPADVLVTEAQVKSEDIAGTRYYTLTGRLLNRSNNVILSPFVNYELYSEATDTIVKAGSIKVSPEVLSSGKETTFQQELDVGGKLKITLVRWKTQDKVLRSNEQMEFFP